jgi:hypothetical protein
MLLDLYQNLHVLESLVKGVVAEALKLSFWRQTDDRRSSTGRIEAAVSPAKSTLQSRVTFVL